MVEPFERQPLERQDTEVFPEGGTPAGATSVEPAAPRRDVEPTPLVAGVVFILLAVLLMTGVDIPADWFGSGIAWVLLIGAGVALLFNELRKARRRR
ncbi:hypothetical protein [Modestobacter versicolor]|uniref:Uncharacterized protein n=1 Tax=Modestobacter versicolor TaxID=429133 RepID=A0A323VC93_9ACTN|nr:hypothetical protein [Modestobacter versicolor]MBB3678133.1 hypothetical protein [Modestobacter versicolor]PZA21673.1 hypothetical protein DMO24_09020 [Modestobacter versicolor]